MPPKAPKKTKQQLEEERLLKEEEDRKARELEAKKKAEEEEKARLEALRIKAEYKKQREEEVSRLSVEFDELLDLNKTMEKQFAAEYKHETDKAEWEKFKEPSGETEATSEKDLNTFISLSSETVINNMVEFVKFAKRIEDVAKSVQDLWADSLAEGNDAVRRRSHAYLISLQEIILEKQDQATSQLLRFVDDHVDDRFEIHVEEAEGGIAVGIWGSFNDIRPIRKAIQFQKLGIQIDVPKQILQQDAKFVHRVTKMSIDTFSLYAYNIRDSLSGTDDQGSIYQTDKFVVGDILIIDIIYSPAPPFSIRAKKWVIRDMSSAATNIRRSAYPSSVPCKCTIKVPDDILMTDDIKAAFWSDEKKMWEEDKCTEFLYNADTRTVTFYTTSVGLVALIKDRVVDFPYKRWSLQAMRTPSSAAAELYEKQCKFTLQNLSAVEIVVDIRSSSCQLLQAKQGAKHAMFADLIGVFSSPGVLLYKLQRRGLNFLPAPADTARIESLPQPSKSAVIEMPVLEAISRTANALDVLSCPAWNQRQSPHIGESRIGLLVRETSAYTGSSEVLDYDCVLAELDAVSESYNRATDGGILPSGLDSVKYTLVMGNRYASYNPLEAVNVSFSHAPRPGECATLHLVKAMTNRVTEETMTRIAGANVKFQKNVFTILRLVKPFSLN